ncbi:MAG: hypothetical protein PHF72_12935, partial [Gammaproteobacteria bacterium]|nr:hypothetical protein [Gammaproteobacteria bacterium]
MELSVPLLFRMRNLNLNQIASEAGYSRQLLYFALRGDRTAPEPLRRLLRERLGADPWSVRAQEPMENRGGH